VRRSKEAAGNAAAVDERWGAFEGQVLAAWHDDGRTMTLLEPFAYGDPAGMRWFAPQGSEVDGASIPQACWSVIGGPFAGRFRNASVVHDVACMEQTANWRDVHWMFYEACRCGGVAVMKAKLMYYAVFHFGPRWEVETTLLVRDGREIRLTKPRDISPPSPTPLDVAAAVAYFASHDPPVEEIPELELEPAARL
jgi:hypothetical protein